MVPRIFHEGIYSSGGKGVSGDAPQIVDDNADIGDEW